ncbi:MAG: fibronectin type III domain-containing protein [Lachnospiraceae bacterium]|nr:fibronectin type III domain-containing protein [Lachnospiraceae bacterium]
MKSKRLACALLALTMATGSGIPAAAAGNSVSWPTNNTEVSASDWGSWSDWLDKYPWNNPELQEPENGNYTAPANITVTSSIGTASRSMKFTWDKVEGADKYIAQLSTSPDFPEDDTRESTNSNTYRSYRISSGGGVWYAPAHATYYFRVKAVYGNHESEWSEVVVSAGDKFPAVPSVN